MRPLLLVFLPGSPPVFLILAVLVATLLATLFLFLLFLLMVFSRFPLLYLFCRRDLLILTLLLICFSRLARCSLLLFALLLILMILMMFVFATLVATRLAVRTRLLPGRRLVATRCMLLFLLFAPLFILYIAVASILCCRCRGPRGTRPRSSALSRRLLGVPSRKCTSPRC
jgi:hypothetical protein